MARGAGYVVGLGCIVLLVAASYMYFYLPVSTVVIVRHAERLNDTDTTSLSPEGFMRANILPHVVRDASIARVFVSEKLRSRLTAEPAIRFLSLPVSVIPADQVDALVDSIKSYPGENILVVGHSDTVPAIIRELGVAPAPSIGRNVFDDLFVVTVGAFRSSYIQLKYGTPS